MLNKTILIGHLGADPELRETNSGIPVANATLCTSESWTENGEKKERTEWHRLVFWRRNAEIVSEFLTKGSKVWVEGKLQTRTYTDKQGIEKKVTEVVADKILMLDSRPKGNGTTEPPSETDEDNIPF